MPALGMGLYHDTKPIVYPAAAQAVQAAPLNIFPLIFPLENHPE
jgi:hypothetical protein